MKSKLIYILVAIAAACIGFGLSRTWIDSHSEASQAPAAAVSQQAQPLTLPEFSLKNRRGELQSVRSWPDKSLILNFWATWCAPCRREIPLLKALQQTHGGEGFQVVGIAVDFRDDVLKYADSMQIDYPLLIGEQDGLEAINAFGIEAIGFPFTVFTDKQERIITTHIGELQQADADLILNAVQRVNRGEISPEAARGEVARSLNASRKLETATASSR